MFNLKSLKILENVLSFRALLNVTWCAHQIIIYGSIKARYRDTPCVTHGASNGTMHVKMCQLVQKMDFLVLFALLRTKPIVTPTRYFQTRVRQASWKIILTSEFLTSNFWFQCNLTYNSILRKFMGSGPEKKLLISAFNFSTVKQSLLLTKTQFLIMIVSTQEKISLCQNFMKSTLISIIIKKWIICETIR